MKFEAIILAAGKGTRMKSSLPKPLHRVAGHPMLGWSIDTAKAAGATRIKRLRDTLGNQIVSELLVKNIARRGYMLAVGKDVIRVI